MASANKTSAHWSLHTSTVEFKCVYQDAFPDSSIKATMIPVGTRTPLDTKTSIATKDRKAPIVTVSLEASRTPVGAMKPVGTMNPMGSRTPVDCMTPLGTVTLMGTTSPSTSITSVSFSRSSQYTDHRENHQASLFMKYRKEKLNNYASQWQS